MSSSTEERLRRALAQEAAATATSPDGWRRIRGRVERTGRFARFGFRRWGVLAPVAAVAVLVVFIVASLVGPGEEGTVNLASGPGRGYLAPTGVDGSFSLVAADNDPPKDSPAGAYRAYGRRAPDGVALEASVVVVVPADFALTGAVPEPLPLRVLGRDVTVTGDGAGTRTLSWTQPDGRSVAVVTFGVAQPDLVILAESLLRGDATKDTPGLPAGFVPIREGTLPQGSPKVSFSTWEAGDGRRFTVNVNDSPDITLDDLAWLHPGGRATTVRGTTGIYADHNQAFLVWMERPGTAVSLYGTGMSEQELMAIAEGLRPVDAGGWRKLVARAPLPSPRIPNGPGSPYPVGQGTPKPLNANNSYFLIRPVQGRPAPPCPVTATGPTEPVVVERRDGQETACYQVGLPEVAADDVTTATAVQNRNSGRWDLEFTLSPDGAARMSGLVRKVGTGGQIVIVVDGQVASAPRVADVSTPFNGVITDLDEPTARHLADRLTK